MGAAWRMLAVVVVFVLALGAIIVQRAQLLESGREIVLAVEPVDPRDFFRGDYVTLTYRDLTMLEVAPTHEVAGMSEGDPVFVALAIDAAGHAAVKSVHATLAAARTASPVVLAGKVTWRFNRTNDEAHDTAVIRTRYGIEAYFVPEGEGRALEAARNARTLEMLIAVDDDGEAAIKGLILDGKRAYVEGIF
jgi:uncharacterized membrane-anchored protein